MDECVAKEIHVCSSINGFERYFDEVAQECKCVLLPTDDDHVGYTFNTKTCQWECNP